MRAADFHYDLPEELIAQHPPAERDGGALMLLPRRSEQGAVTHHQVVDLPLLLPPGCLLVVNDTRVIPARVLARRPSGGKVELLLLEQLDSSKGQVWRCMMRASKSPRRGEQLLLPDGQSQVTLLTRPEHGRCTVSLRQGQLTDFGAVPLPPYIRRDAGEADAQRYQTVYAKQGESVAAPTAGLHFTPTLLQRVKEAGVQVEAVTLHVGPGTFVPVRTELVQDHQMEQERYHVPQHTADEIQRARQQGRPVVAVGTTVVRTLEATGGQAGQGRTELFIVPGHRFKVVDGLLTNFHLPGSTLLMLVSALAGQPRVLEAYQEAVRQRYRFYSYGDAMLIL